MLSGTIVKCSPSVRIDPEQGAAVVFNGEVWHEGLAVESGIRHLYVASFDMATTVGSGVAAADEATDDVSDD